MSGLIICPWSCIFIYECMTMYIHIYIYICREREREILCMCPGDVHLHDVQADGHPAARGPAANPNYAIT